MLEGLVFEIPCNQKMRYINRACSPEMTEGVKEVMLGTNLKYKPITVIPNFAENHFYRLDIDGSKARQER